MEGAVDRALEAMAVPYEPSGYHVLQFLQVEASPLLLHLGLPFPLQGILPFAPCPSNTFVDPTKFKGHSYAALAPLLTVIQMREAVPYSGQSPAIQHEFP